MQKTTKGIYILLEKSSSNNDNSISAYDCMGYVHKEITAINWRDENIDYRTYKYCKNTCKEEQ